MSHALPTALLPATPRSPRLSAVGVLVFELLMPAAALILSVPTAAVAQEPAPAGPESGVGGIRGDLELAVTEMLQPLARRLVFRDDQNAYDVWLVAKLDFEQTAENFRQAISAKRQLASGFRIDRWTWLEPDHSYVIDVLGGPRPHRLRLTRHLTGALLELGGAGAADDAPRWAPPYRPRPILLPHGVAR